MRSRVEETSPGVPVRCFALVRTMSSADVAAILDPVEGTITDAGGSLLRRIRPAAFSERLHNPPLPADGGERNSLQARRPAEPVHGLEHREELPPHRGVGLERQ